MAENLLKITLENPTIESLTQALYKVVDAYDHIAEENKKLVAKCEELERENERLRRQLNNNSKNSSKPSSTDQKPSKASKESKASNTYNSREKSAHKKGAQKGHAGKGLTKEFAQKLIDNKEAEHQVVYVGKGSDSYESRYVLDLKIRPVVTEIRFYADKYAPNPFLADFNSPVTYGSTIKSICTLLYSEGVVSNDRIQGIINSLSGNVLSISTGAVYNICRSFVNASKSKYDSIVQRVLASQVVATDATNISIDGAQKYIRNFSLDECCLYESQEAKSIACMNESAVLPNYEGTLIHDHETAIYHFGSEHGECNAHIFRYLQKNTEEAKSKWSGEMKALLSEANRACKAARLARSSVDEAYVAKVESQYDSILAKGWEENKKTKGFTAATEERRLLNRLKEYKKEHLLFLKDLRVPFTNNMSERDLRKCKNRQKMSGGFRSIAGCDMYSKIISVVETWKREGINLLEAMKQIFIASMNLPCRVQAYL